MMISQRHASPEEVAIALAALTAADFVRLGRIAQLRARGLPEVDWRDLVQDAIQRALEGVRRWPLDVSFLAFLAETMRSLASEAWRRRRVTHIPIADTPDMQSPGEGDSLADTAADPERVMIARDLLASLTQAFADDRAARAVLDGVANELSPGEIQLRAGLSPTEYDSTRRRMRRLIARMTLENDR